MKIINRTSLDSAKLGEMVLGAVGTWPHDGLVVTVRYSRGAEFSGTCYYQTARIFINVGRHNQYPYAIRTAIARPRSNARCWWRELYTIAAADAYQLVLFVFLHEFYHWLVRKARRNVRQKEARCDRFAARILVDRCGAEVRDPHGRSVPRSAWDFQDLDHFVAAALRTRPRRPCRPAALTPIAVGPGGLPAAPPADRQLLLFDM
jgi:hypothetical protein